MRRALVVFLLLLSATPALAVTPVPPGNCGGGLPCGPLPWTLPVFPNLMSVTPIVDLHVTPLFLTSTPSATPTLTPTYTITPSPTNTVTPSITPTPTPSTPIFDPSTLQAQMQTLQAMIAGTDMAVVDLQGTPVNLSTQTADLTTKANGFWSLVKGIGGVSFGPVGPLVSFLFTSFAIVVLVKVTGFLLPVLVAIWGIVRKIIQLVLDFIPF